MPTPDNEPVATIDFDRQARCGYPEVVLAEGKSVAAVVQIVERLIAAGQPPLVTRLAPDQLSALIESQSEGIAQPAARTFRLPTPIRSRDSVVIATAGTGDLPVAEEARETLRWMGHEPGWIVDVGVAGPHRLTPHLPVLQGAQVVIVCAGMEGALPSVVGGHVRCPVIAVPTSIGYGASFQGVAALLGMLNSCAANVAVVNIDAGFKAGYLAGLILQNREAVAASSV